MRSESAPYSGFNWSDRKPKMKVPKPMPMRLLISSRLADAVARIAGGTRCWTALTTGPSHASESM